MDRLSATKLVPPTGPYQWEGCAGYLGGLKTRPYKGQMNSPFWVDGHPTPAMGEIVSQLGTTPSWFLHPCLWLWVSPVLIWLVGMGFVSPTRKIILLQTVQEVKSGVEALLVDEAMAMIPIRFCWPLWCPGIRGSWSYNGCRTKPMGYGTPASWMSIVGGPPCPAFSSGDNRGAAEAAPAYWTSPGVNLQQVLCVSSWKILSLSEDHRLPYYWMSSVSWRWI